MITPVELIRKLSSPLEPVPTGARPHIPQAIHHIKAFIFDIYGTLFISAAGDIGKDSASHSKEAFYQALKDAEIATIDESLHDLSKATDIFRDEIMAYHNIMHSRGVEFPEVDICEIWLKVLYKLGISNLNNVSKRQIELLALSYECRTNPAWPMPGAKELLESLSKKGKRIGIISNAQFYTPLMFQALMGKDIYELGFEKELCLFSYLENIAKPSEQMFHKISQRLSGKHGINPKDTIYIGNDMVKDILPASRMNWKTALFAGDRRSLRLREDNPRVKDIKPWCTVTEFDQLLEKL